MIVSALVAYLETVPAVYTLLAYHPLLAGKHAIYANVPQEGTSSPHIVITNTDGSAVTHLQSADAGLADALVDVEIYTEQSQGYGAAEAIKEQLRLALTTIGNTWNGVDIQRCVLTDLRDQDFPPPENGNEWVHQIGWQADIWYSRTPVMT